MTGPEVGPSAASLTERAADELAAQGRPMLAEAVRQAGAYNRQLLEHIDTLTGLVSDATGVGEAHARMYALAAEQGRDYRDALRRIARATDLEDARRIAQGALS